MIRKTKGRNFFYRRMIRALLLAILFGMVSFAQAEGIEILSSSYVPDAEFPALLPFIIDKWYLRYSMADPPAYQNMVPAGAALHLFLRNDSKAPGLIQGVLLNDIDLARHIIPKHREHEGVRAASYILNDLETTPQDVRDRLDSLGAPIWFQVRPNPVPAGGFSEAIIRLRSLPKEKSLVMAIKTPGEKTVGKTIATDKSDTLFLSSISFSEAINRIYVYVSSAEKAEFELFSVDLDGKMVPLGAEIPRKSFHGFLPLDIPLPDSWNYGSYHHVAVTAADGRVAASLVRSRDNFFALGMWGYRNYGNTDEERARDTCSAFRDHLFNTHMGMSGNQTGFLRSAEGLEMLKQMDLHLMVRDPSRPDLRNPFVYARFIKDEPDAHEDAINELPPNRRLGSYAQGLVDLQKKWTDTDPRTLTLLNVDLTYKPENWLTYGQLPDILALDPYYQMRLMDVYSRFPGALPMNCHPYYVFALSELARWASQPRPLHVILNSVSWRQGDDRFRFGTPEEKRIEFYYALAAGAKGISYWWFTPYGECYGCGSEEPEARAMMKEMARLNAEARAILPLLARSCPGAPAGEKIDPFTLCRPSWLMARTLFSGTDTVLAILVNRNHLSDRVGTKYEPIPKAPIAFLKPPWMKEIHAYRFASGKMEKIPYTIEDRELKMDIMNIALTEILIFTEKQEIAPEVEKRWRNLLPMLESVTAK